VKKSNGQAEMEKHFNSIKKELAEFVIKDCEVVYPMQTMYWLENDRLVRQNKSGWGDERRKFLSRIAEKFPDIENIGVIGVGGRPLQIVDLLSVFRKTKKIIVFELSKQKIEAASRYLSEHGVEIAMIEFIDGDATKNLAKYQERFDLLDNHLVLQWQPITKEQDLLTGLIVAMKEALKPESIMACADLSIGDGKWGIYHSKGMLEFSREILYGGKKFPGLADLCWIKRGFSVWTGAGDINKVIEKNNFQCLPEFSVSFNADCEAAEGCENYRCIVGDIIAACCLGLRIQTTALERVFAQQPGNESLKNSLAMVRESSKYLDENILDFFELLQKEEYSLQVPAMHYALFSKTSSQ
jgi:hypothetical protein